MKGDLMKVISTVSLMLALLASSAKLAVADDSNPLFRETKVANYLPHMTWAEVEEALTETDMVLIPVGSIEQHGKHLPLGTDLYAAIEICKLISQETKVVVAPAVFAGLSEYHMDFPGSLTLSPETFEAVVFETAQSLIRHGFRKVLIYNGHGGNGTSVAKVIHRINQTTPAVAVDLSGVSEPPWTAIAPTASYDGHAGEGETASMLYLAGSLVDLTQSEKPTLNFPPIAEAIMKSQDKEPGLESLLAASTYLPKETGKQASSREMSSTGVFTLGDTAKATAEQGGQQARRYIDAAVKFIEAWKKIDS
jgi:creatinine amidohydrolase